MYVWDERSEGGWQCSIYSECIDEKINFSCVKLRKEEEEKKFSSDKINYFWGARRDKIFHFSYSWCEWMHAEEGICISMHRMWREKKIEKNLINSRIDGLFSRFETFFISKSEWTCKSHPFEDITAVGSLQDNPSSIWNFFTLISQ